MKWFILEKHTLKVYASKKHKYSWYQLWSVIYGKQIEIQNINSANTKAIK